MNAHQQIVEIPSKHTRPDGGERPMWSVTLDTRIQGTPLRVLYAFTIPEYVEAWLIAPGIDRVRCQNDPRSLNKLDIAFCRAGFQARRVSLQYVHRQLHTLHIDWQVAGELPANGTRVKLVLRQRDAHTFLHVRHSGFLSSQEWYWHQQMWKDSLERIRTLIR